MAIAAALRPLSRYVRRPVAIAAVHLAGVLVLLLLARVSMVQVQTWRNSYTMWEKCLTSLPHESDGTSMLRRYPRSTWAI